MSWPPPSIWGASYPPGSAAPGVPPSAPNMMGMSYTPEQWAVMQQQNWHQWTQWQQQYAQWQNQYGEKYAEQMQLMQGMGVMPPLPPSQPAPPVPPPPDKPPPPPHENDQPLYAQSQPAAVPALKSKLPINPQNQQNLSSENLPTEESGGQLWNGGHLPTNSKKKSLSVNNSDALKKLLEEERLFDIQFQKWEEEFNKWKNENVNHPDRRAYSEYEQKFESCRAQLLERRQQMKQKRAKLMNNTAPGTTTEFSNHGTTASSQSAQHSQSTSQNKVISNQNNYNREVPVLTLPLSKKTDLSHKNQADHFNYAIAPNAGNRSTLINDRYNSSNDRFNNPNVRYNDSNNRHNDPNDRFNDPNDKFNDPNDRFNDPNDRYFDPNDRYNNPNDRYNSNDRYSEEQPQFDNVNTDNYGPPNKANSNFINTSEARKGIPGLDLVREEEYNMSTIFKSKQDVIDITGEAPIVEQPKQHDFSAISQGINNILGDEKIMNILSIVRGEKLPPGNNQDIVKRPDISISQEGEYERNTSKVPIKLQNYTQNNYSLASGTSNDQWDLNSNQSNFNSQRCNNQAQNQAYARQAPDSTRFSGHQRTDTNLTGSIPPNQRMISDIGQNMQQFDIPTRQNFRDSRDTYFNQENNQYAGRGNYHDDPNIDRQDMQTRVKRDNMKDLRIHQNMIPARDSQRPFPGQQNIPSLIDIHLQHDRALPPVRPLLLGNQDKSLLPEKDIAIEVNQQVKADPKWVDEPIFEATIIVDYDHKQLRMKARDFIEPVQTFDYNHISKGEDYKCVTIDRSVELDLYHRKTGTKVIDYKNQKPDNLFMDKVYNFTSRREFIESKSSSRYKDYGNSDKPRYPPKPDLRDDIIRDRSPYDERRKTDDKYGDRRRYHDRLDDRQDLKRIPNDRYEKDRHSRYKDVERDRFRTRVSPEHRRDEHKNQSHSREKSKNNDICIIEENTEDKPAKVIDSGNQTKNKTSDEFWGPKCLIMIDDLLELPGREARPEKIVIILRGPPGSGKSYLAKLIKDREVENGGSAPRILSIDDYFVQESLVDETDPVTGKIVRKSVMQYEYDESLEESYFNSLKRAFRRTVTDGYFPFIIVDAPNEHLKSYADLWNFGRQHGFQVYICTMEMDANVCFKRNIHNRKLEDIEVIISRFFETPSHHISLDPTTLLQSGSINEVQMEDVDCDDVVMEETQKSEVTTTCTSKWEKMDDAEQLARLDGTNKPLRPSKYSLEDYLQLDDWQPARSAKPGKKTVRWADIEERREQEKMRAIGFVVGQTNWERMTDPTMGSSALTQTKYIERVGRYQ